MPLCPRPRDFAFLAILTFFLTAAAAAPTPDLLGCVRTAHFQAYFDSKIPRMRISDEGGIGRNLKSYSDPAAQRSALLWVLHGVTRSDTASLEKGLRALALPIQHMHEDGAFRFTAAGGRKARPGEVYGESMYVGALGEAACSLRGTPYALEYLPRILQHEAAVRRWFARVTAMQNEVLTADREFGNRLAFNALAYLSWGSVLNDVALHESGEAYLRALLEKQDTTGYFPDKGGPDTSYNAVTAWKVQVCALLTRSPEFRSSLMAAVRKSMAWELERIDAATGEVRVAENIRTGRAQEKFLGHDKDVNYEEVAYSLFYWETLGPDPAAGKLGAKVLDYARRKYGASP